MLMTMLGCFWAGISLVPALLFFYLAWQTEEWWRCVLGFLLVFFAWPIMITPLVRDWLEERFFVK